MYKIATPKFLILEAIYMIAAKCNSILYNINLVKFSSRDENLVTCMLLENKILLNTIGT